jgi:hypothetical protein
MIWLILGPDSIQWAESEVEAIRLGKIYNAVVVVLPGLYDYRIPRDVYPVIPEHECLDSWHCTDYGCLLYNEDGSRKTVRQSRHSVWNGELT